MNPFGATVGPDFGAAAAPAPQAYGMPPAPHAAPQNAYGPPPAAPYGPPPAQGYAPPAQAYSPPAQAYSPPAQAYSPPAQAYSPPAQQAGPPQAHGTPAHPQWPPTPAPAQQSHDPSAFAATAPPPTTDEHEANVRRSSQAPAYPSAPPVAVAPAPAAPLGYGRDPESVEAGAIRALAGFLVSYDQSELGVFWPLYQGQNVVGRKGAAPGLDIEIDSPTTSSRHATVYASARPGRLKVEDGGSTNGTFLNDTQLERGKKFELRDNDVLRLGGFNVTVKIV
ncbi:MAG: FHA domain-containing protein [Pseudomonadota bacterium]